MHNSTIEMDLLLGLLFVNQIRDLTILADESMVSISTRMRQLSELKVCPYELKCQ